MCTCLYKKKQVSGTLFGFIWSVSPWSPQSCLGALNRIINKLHWGLTNVFATSLGTTPTATVLFKMKARQRSTCQRATSLFHIFNSFSFRGNGRLSMQRLANIWRFPRRLCRVRSMLPEIAVVWIPVPVVTDTRKGWRTRDSSRITSLPALRWRMILRISAGKNKVCLLLWSLFKKTSESHP